MTKIECIYYFSASIFYILIIIGLIWFVIGLLRAWACERKIHKLYNELETKINEEKKRPIPMPIINGVIKKLREDYNPKIKELERKRQFILDKLPFIK